MPHNEINKPLTASAITKDRQPPGEQEEQLTDPPTPLLHKRVRPFDHQSTGK